jgi:diguanylate cyclase (GGDEF)-like protein/PAS domain S-box-containing protein
MDAPLAMDVDVVAEHEALLQFLYLAPVGLVQTDLRGDIAMINPISAQLLMPLAPGACLNNLFDALADVAPELRHVCALFTASSGMICEGRQIFLRRDRVRLQRGTPNVLSISLVKLDESRLMAVISDVTEQVRRERQLKHTDAWLSAILTNISDYAIVSLDRAGVVSEWNETIARVTQFGPEVVGQPYSAFFPDGATTHERQFDRLREAEDNGWNLEEGPRMRADGTQFWGSAMISPLPEKGMLDDDEPDTAYCMILRDISDHHAANEAARSAAFSDQLTGVSNRRAFFDAAELELERRRQSPRATSLVVFDVDHLTVINERFGNNAGDQVLRELAALLRTTFREVDVVARMGGKEFAVLLPSTDLAGAFAVAERVRALVAVQPAALDGKLINFTVSAGVAEMDEQATDLTALMARAEQAMRGAKKDGRNLVAGWHGAAPALSPALSPDSSTPIAPL